MPAQAAGILSRSENESITDFWIKKQAAYQTIPFVISNTKCHKWLFLNQLYANVPNGITQKRVLFWCRSDVVRMVFAKWRFLRTASEQGYNTGRLYHREKY